MELPVIPAPVLWILCLVMLVVGARFRLSALLMAGATRPGPRRLSRTAWLVLLDGLSFLSIFFVLRPGPFPAMMAGIFNFGLTAGLLAVQWYFHSLRHRQKAGGLRSAVQGLQAVALLEIYGRVEERVRVEFHKSRWQWGGIYQALMLVICVGMTLLDKLQGGWLYYLFALLWQSAVTATLYAVVDRRLAKRSARKAARKAADAASKAPAPSNGAASQAPPPPGPAPSGGTSGSSGGTIDIGGFKVPETLQLPGGITLPLGDLLGRVAPKQAGPAGAPGSSAAGPAASGPGAAAPGVKAKRRFATRPDVQAVVALTAGVWCGLFARYLGFWYGFAAVTTFRTLLNMGTPLTSLLLSRLIPQPLHGYFRPAGARSLWSLDYYRSPEFWLGPGMGVIGGILGGLIRHYLWPS